MMKYWFAVESYENWLADKQAGFKYYGVAQSKLKLAETVSNGDRIIMYVSSGMSSLADVRVVVEDGIKRATTKIGYDSPFSMTIRTEPSTVLAESDWIPLREVAPSLEFTREVSDLRYLLRNSLRVLTTSDGEFLAGRLADSRKYPP